jgi:hypothetical protein
VGFRQRWCGRRKREVLPLPNLLVLGQDQDVSYAEAGVQRQASDRAVQIVKTPKDSRSPPPRGKMAGKQKSMRLAGV